MGAHINPILIKKNREQNSGQFDIKKQFSKKIDLIHFYTTRLNWTWLVQ